MRPGPVRRRPETKDAGNSKLATVFGVIFGVNENAEGHQIVEIIGSHTRMINESQVLENKGEFVPTKPKVRKKTTSFVDVRINN